MSEEHSEGFAKHLAEEGFDFTKALAENMFGVIFSSELDFFTKLLSIICILSILIEIAYLIQPPLTRKKIDKWDYDEDRPKKKFFTKSSIPAAVFLLILFSNLIQKYSVAEHSFEAKMAESRIEKEFRHRQLFLVDMHTFQLIIIVGVWLSINGMLKINRDRARGQQIIADSKKQGGAKEVEVPQVTKVEDAKTDQPLKEDVVVDEPEKSADAKKKD